MKPKFKIGDQVETKTRYGTYYRGEIIGIEENEGKISYEIKPTSDFWEDEEDIGYINYN